MYSTYDETSRAPFLGTLNVLRDGWGRRFLKILHVADYEKRETQMSDSHFYHVEVATPDRSASQDNASLDDVLNEIAVPYRLNRQFLVDGYEFRPSFITRFKIRKTDARIDQNEVLSGLDWSSLGNAFTSAVAAGSRLKDGNDVTSDLLARADQIIAESGQTPEPHSPIFDRTDPSSVFVVSSFAKEFDQNFDAIDRTCKSYGLNAVRVDKEMSSESIIDRIQRHLLNATYVIADLTHARPNCYYEIGFFDALLIARRVQSTNHLLFVAKNIETDAHFDLKHRGIETYDNPFTLMEIAEKWFSDRGLAKI